MLDYFPNYIIYTINSILSVDKSARVILCTNQNIILNCERLEIIQVNHLHSQFLEKLNSLEVYKNTIFTTNPLWITSLKRIFCIEAVMDKLNLKNCIHFDNDVLVYKSYQDLINYFSQERINITSYNRKRLIFGYSFFPSYKLVRQLCENILEKVIYNKNNSWTSNNGKPYNEMELLNLVYEDNKRQFSLLSSLPYNNLQIFDPAGYGQYIDGTFVNPHKIYKKRFTSSNDPVGVEIKSKRIKVKFTDEPFVIWKEKLFDLANLHIHSKRLHKYLPKLYQEFIN